MTKDEAIKHMRSGGRVAHRSFTSGEWVQENGARYEFEDGCTCEISEFWIMRDEPSRLARVLTR